MGRKKYYSVRTGKVPGIYESWEDCKKSIDGFSNAEYKAFASREDAVSYLNNQDIGEREKVKAQQIDSVIAYVDGSYSDIIKRYSYGCILIMPSGEIVRKYGSGNDPRALSARNVAGELQGAMYAVKAALDLGYKRIIIKHDYIGISKWYSGEWKAKDEISKIYINYLYKYKDKIEISFEKVVAHSGDKYNEEADKLAKSALKVNEELKKDEVKKNNIENSRENIIKLIKESIMESCEVIDFLGITRQKLAAFNKSGKLIAIKKGIYLKSDVEQIKIEIEEN
ncbi:MAG: ribonuclease H family protein [Clostridium sp.]|uniref:ribonuclease H family protein n=1 Tax=Clostridium sp. TaxID=1506 RepID=UPI0029141FFC|nr:ribonuclease H family protein [Clostridium sp.]MDU7947776.1 ribonuclease H family protein [Clostridium sp.]